MSPSASRNLNRVLTVKRAAQVSLALLLTSLVACQSRTTGKPAGQDDTTPPAISFGISPFADAAPSVVVPVESLVGEGFRDDFERSELGPDWRSEGREFRIESGRLVTRSTGNRGLWLRRALPRDVRIEFTARAEGTAADVKVELFGDGEAMAPTSGYIVIFGGWGNTLNVIARRDERDAARAVGAPIRIVKGKTHRLRIERQGNVVEAFIDGRFMARYDDPRPLEGPGHEFFAFSGWQSEIWYDDLEITPL